VKERLKNIHATEPGEPNMHHICPKSKNPAKLANQAIPQAASPSLTGFLKNLHT